MTDTPTAVTPLSASACGKTNAFCHGCPVVQQDMNYAACLNRIAVITADQKVPADWRTCADPVRAGSCPAKVMRDQEELAGKALFFRPRDLLQAASDAARRWFMPGDPKTPAPGRRASTGRARSVDALDALGDAGSFADAFNATAAPAAATPDPFHHEVRPHRGGLPAVMPVALPGETPLQMARRYAQRLKAEQAAKTA